METFSALPALCAGNSLVNSPHKGQWHGALVIYLISALNKQLSKQPRGWWFQTPSRPLLRHYNVMASHRTCDNPLPLVILTKISENIRGHKASMTLHWRHNDHDSVSNHQPHGCLLNHLFRRRSKETSKLRVTGLCVGNSPGPVNSPHKGPVTRKMFPFDDVIMSYCFPVVDETIS